MYENAEVEITYNYGKNRKKFHTGRQILQWDGLPVFHHQIL